MEVAMEVAMVAVVLVVVVQAVVQAVVLVVVVQAVVQARRTAAPIDPRQETQRQNENHQQNARRITVVQVLAVSVRGVLSQLIRLPQTCRGMLRSVHNELQKRGQERGRREWHQQSVRQLG
jgi:hypothetical protein